MADKTLDELRKKRAMLLHLIAMDIQLFPDTLKSPVQVQGETDELHDALGVALAACERQIGERVRYINDLLGNLVPGVMMEVKTLIELDCEMRAELARHRAAMKEQSQ